MQYYIAKSIQWSTFSWNELIAGSRYKFLGIFQQSFYDDWQLVHQEKKRV